MPAQCVTCNRDLKAENVLQRPDGTWVICDFGSSTSRAKVYNTVQEIAEEEEIIRKQTTPAYRPPEVGQISQWKLRSAVMCFPI